MDKNMTSGGHSVLLFLTLTFLAGFAVCPRVDAKGGAVRITREGYLGKKRGFFGKIRRALSQKFGNGKKQKKELAAAEKDWEVKNKSGTQAEKLESAAQLAGLRIRSFLKMAKGNKNIIFDPVSNQISVREGKGSKALHRDVDQFKHDLKFLNQLERASSLEKTKAGDVVLDRKVEFDDTKIGIPSEYMPQKRIVNVLSLPKSEQQTFTQEASPLRSESFLSGHEVVIPPEHAAVGRGSKGVASAAGKMVENPAGVAGKQWRTTETGKTVLGHKPAEVFIQGPKEAVEKVAASSTAVTGPSKALGGKVWTEQEVVSSKLEKLVQGIREKAGLGRELVAPDTRVARTRKAAQEATQQFETEWKTGGKEMSSQGGKGKKETGGSAGSQAGKLEKLVEKGLKRISKKGTASVRPPETLGSFFTKVVEKESGIADKAKVVPAEMYKYAEKATSQSK